MWRQALYPYLLPKIAKELEKLHACEAAQTTEVRMRTNRPVEVVMAGTGRMLQAALNQTEMEALVSSLCAHSRYAYDSQMAMGYIPLPGGHRAGVCGHAVQENGRFMRMSAITSVCLRIAHAVPGASAAVQRHLIGSGGRARRVLFLGPPGCGKTTVLRDAALYLSDEKGLHVAVADEREELFPSLCEEKNGVRIDVLESASKAEAVMLLLRSMSPQVIVTDEIGRKEDVSALLEAARCGVGVLASAHANGIRGMLGRPILRTLYDVQAFERYVFLGVRGACLAVYDQDGRLLEGKEETDDEPGYGADGDDCGERFGVYDCGR